MKQQFFKKIIINIMNLLEKILLERIDFNPNILAGKANIRGFRISVEQILKLLAHKTTETQILTNFPELEPEDIQACLLYASQLLENEKVFKIN